MGASVGVKDKKEAKGKKEELTESAPFKVHSLSGAYKFQQQQGNI